VGGGNFFRGMNSPLPGCDRVSADHIGMLATVMNALALGHALRERGATARVLSAFPVGALVEAYSVDAATAALSRGDVVVLGGGGNFFRGMNSPLPGCDRVSADHIGMLATVMNALALGHALRERGATARVLSAFPVGALVEAYSVDAATAALSRGDVVVLGG